MISVLKAGKGSRVLFPFGFTCITFYIIHYEGVS